MKIKIILTIILFLCQKSFTQNKEWFAYDLDSIVSLEMPFIVYEIDTVIDYNKLYQIYSEDDSSKFIVQKSYFGKLYSNIESPSLPINEKSLNKYYRDVMNTFDEIIEYNFDSKKQIQKNNLNGYQLIYKNDDDIQVYEMNLFFFNKNLYSFSYVNENGLDKIDSKKFFDSITFDDQKKLLQYPETSIKKKIIISLLIVLFLSFIFRYGTNRKKRPN